jgi:hypothetical protein
LPSVGQPFLDRQIGGCQRVRDFRSGLAVAVQPIAFRPAATDVFLNRAGDRAAIVIDVNDVSPALTAGLASGPAYE